MVKTGSINMAKAIRRIGHRSGQARKMTFYRDAIESKDEYGVETDTIAAGNQGLTIPNIDAFLSPITTSSDALTRAGHTVMGNASLYIPSLTTIKNNILGVTDSGAHNTRLSSFNEIESKDILYDMEKIVYSADSASSSTTSGGKVNSETYTLPSNTPCFEGDRLQFKVKERLEDTNRLTTIVLNSSGGKSLTWSFIDTSNPNFEDTKYHIIDIPLSNISTGDRAYYIYTQPGGANGIRTLDATVNNSFDITDIDGETNTLTNIVITSSNPSLSCGGLITKDLRIYKAGEWRIDEIKEYRDEYMELQCSKIRGERGSRRRAY